MYLGELQGKKGAIAHLAKSFLKRHYVNQSEGENTSKRYAVMKADRPAPDSRLLARPMSRKERSTALDLVSSFVQ